MGHLAPARSWPRDILEQAQASCQRRGQGCSGEGVRTVGRGEHKGSLGRPACPHRDCGDVHTGAPLHARKGDLAMQWFKN